MTGILNHQKVCNLAIGMMCCIFWRVVHAAYWIEIGRYIEANNYDEKDNLGECSSRLFCLVKLYCRTGKPDCCSCYNEITSKRKVAKWNLCLQDTGKTKKNLHARLY